MKTILRKSGEGLILKDAVRDLVVVVVGILGALWIESTWQDLQDRAEERQILVGLRSEFSNNRNDLDSRIATWRTAMNQFTEAHKLIGGPINDETKAAFAGSWSLPAGNLWFDPGFGQLTSVINSGQLGLIENPELRALIAGWPALIDDLEFERQMFSYAVTDGYGSDQREYGVAWPDSSFDADIEHLMTSRRFDNELSVMALVYRILTIEGQVIRETTDRIIELIDVELGDR